MMDAWIIEEIERRERRRREREDQWRRQLPLEQPLPELDEPEREHVEHEHDGWHDVRGAVDVDFACCGGERFRL